MERKFFFDKVIRKIQNKNKIALYGSGKHTQMLLDYFDENIKNKVIGIIDNKKENIGKFKFGYKIYELNDIKNSLDAIIISSDVYQEVIYDRIAYLKGEGIEILKIYEDIPTVNNICLLEQIEKYEVKKLRKEDNEEWNKFVDESPQGSIFNKTWWMDAVQARYEIYVCIDKNKDIIGGMILTFDKNGNISMPLLTQTLGILFSDFNDCKYATKLTKEKDIIESLIKYIPNDKQYFMQYNYNFTNWLPFMWNGYSQYCRYTYVIDNLDDVDEIKSNFKSNTRGYINKSIKRGLKIKEDLSIEDFYYINKKTFERQGLNIPYSLEFLKHFDNFLKQYNACKSIFILNEDGKIIAGIYLVYDKRTTYYLMSGVDNSEKSSGAISFALWEAIKFSRNVSKCFDFEGSCIRGIEEFFRSFGAKQKMYFAIWRK